MRTGIVLMVLLVQASALYAQPAERTIPLTPDRWEVEPGRAAFIAHKSVPAIRIQGRDQDDLFERPAHVVLKDLDFSDGIIEFDVELTEYPFAVIYFRREDALNADMLYLRTYRVDDPTGPDAVQYTAVTNGAPLWDLHPRFQGPAVLHRDAWNHVRLVISGKQMQVYVNSTTEPTLVIPQWPAVHPTGALPSRAAPHLPTSSSHPVNRRICHRPQDLTLPGTTPVIYAPGT